MKDASFLTICMNPTIQKTLRFGRLAVDTVNRTGDYRMDASGKGVNVTRVLTQLGKKCVHLTHLGGPLRPLFLQLCAADGLSLEWVESGSPIRFCYTLINDADNTVTELVEEAEAVGAGTGERLTRAYAGMLPLFSTVIISGAKAAGYSDALVPDLVKKAKEAGLQVILDVRGGDLTGSLEYHADIIKPNLYEFAQTFAPGLISGNGIAADEGTVKEQVKKAALGLVEKYGSRIVLTRGSRPVWAFDGDGFHEYAVETVRPVNTTGSGDAFTAGLAAGLADGASFAEAIARGARCGLLNAGLFKGGVIR
ncbi:MAG: PfkB family carbohydrate kinase [Treponema sp.]|jgi:1-phosphofructokinase/tagatose 6-phosphate kinase|nr:PfkB family carbohydrate kinase [Treponema sp.]